MAAIITMCIVHQHSQHPIFQVIISNLDAHVALEGPLLGHQVFKWTASSLLMLISSSNGYRIMINVQVPKAFLCKVVMTQKWCHPSLLKCHMHTLSCGNPSWKQCGVPRRESPLGMWQCSMNQK